MRYADHSNVHLLVLTAAVALAGVFTTPTSAQNQLNPVLTQPRPCISTPRGVYCGPTATAGAQWTTGYFPSAVDVNEFLATLDPQLAAEAKVLYFEATDTWGVFYRTILDTPRPTNTHRETIPAPAPHR